MGVCPTDLVTESVIRDAFAAIRQNPARLDDLFDHYQEPWLQKIYGDDAINKVKAFILENRIEIVQGFNQIPSKLPCISINLASATEMRDLAVMSDFADTVEEDLPASEIEVLASFVPTSYDSTTGILLIPNSADISVITTSNVLTDTAGVEFSIIGGINDTVGSKMMNIGPGKTPDISGTCKILSNVNFERYLINMIPINENIQVGIHTENAYLTKILYYIVIYSFQMRRDTFIRRGVELTSFSSSDFMRESQFLPENTFSRWITLNGISRLYYKAKQATIAEEIQMNVFVERDEYPIDNEIDFEVKTTP